MPVHFFSTRLDLEHGCGHCVDQFLNAEVVGDSKTIHVSKSRPFWNKCFILQYGMVYNTHSKDDLGRRHISEIHQATTAPPSFLGLNLKEEGQKALQ